jgi:hypothetical protein
MNNSRVEESVFETGSAPNGTLFRVRGSTFSFENVEFTAAGKNQSLISLDTCVSVRIDRCTFHLPEVEALALEAVSSPDIKIVRCSFNASASIVGNVTESLVMVTLSCFAPGSPGEVEQRFNTIENGLVSGPDIQFHEWCPWEDSTSTLSPEQKAYAIATVVIFFFCFAVLFIGLIIFVFCKARTEEEVECAEVQQEPGLLDDVADIDIPSG